MAQHFLRGKTALVTGAARGIGLSIATELRRAGCHVALTDVDREAAQAAAEGLAGGEGRVLVLELDVCDGDAWRTVVAQVESELGPVDILVNNAGIMIVGHYLDVEESHERRQMDINVWGVLYGQRAVLPTMIRRQSGHIVNIASVAGRVGTPFAAVYSGSKFAVVGITEAVAMEVRDFGVHCTVVCPSLVETELISGTRRPRWPGVVTPEQVAKATVSAIRTRKEVVFVPRSGRLSIVLPALLPRRINRWIAHWLGMDRLFKQVDEAERDSYRNRVFSAE